MKYVLKVIFEFIANDVLWNIIKFIIIDKMEIKYCYYIFNIYYYIWIILRC